MVIRRLLEELQRRNTASKNENDIFIRPDHAHQMMGDINKTINSGIGRLNGLAEIQAVIKAIFATL